MASCRNRPTTKASTGKSESKIQTENKFGLAGELVPEMLKHFVPNLIVIIENTLLLLGYQLIQNVTSTGQCLDC